MYLSERMNHLTLIPLALALLLAAAPLRAEQPKKFALLVGGGIKNENEPVDYFTDTAVFLGPRTPTSGKAGTKHRPSRCA